MRQNALPRIGNFAYVDCQVSRGEMSSSFSVFSDQALAQQRGKGIHLVMIPQLQFIAPRRKRAQARRCLEWSASSASPHPLVVSHPG